MFDKLNMMHALIGIQLRIKPRQTTNGNERVRFCRMRSANWCGGCAVVIIHSSDVLCVVYKLDTTYRQSCFLFCLLI